MRSWFWLALILLSTRSFAIVPEDVCTPYFSAEAVASALWGETWIVLNSDASLEYRPVESSGVVLNRFALVPRSFLMAHPFIAGAVSSDGKLVAIAFGNGRVRVYKTASLQLVVDEAFPDRSPFVAIRFENGVTVSSADGSRMEVGLPQALSAVP